MKRIAISLVLFSLAAALFGCGGSTGVPTDDDLGGNLTNQPGASVPLAPDEVLGSHRVSIVPGQLNIVTGATEDELRALVGKHGYTVLHQNGGRATIGLPYDADLGQAAAVLTKEYNIVSAEPVHRIHTPRTIYRAEDLRSASFTPLDPMYGDQFVALERFDNDTPGDPSDDYWGYALFAGQAMTLNVMGFPGGWDVSDPLNMRNDVADQPVVVALIDAGWFDYSAVGRIGFDETLLDDLNSGFVAADGTFTPGLAAAAWDLDDDGDPATRDFPYRSTGELMLGILAAGVNDYFPRTLDFDGSTDITDDEVWNEGIAGINPNATYILVKTGELDGDAWSFTDGHIAESIDHAVGAGANIILLGMFGLGPVGTNVSTAIQNARDNDVLVIAPAGDVIDSWNGDAGQGWFDDTPVDITVDIVSPASDANCISVTGTGFDRVGDLPDLDFDPAGPGPEDVANTGRGWTPGFTEPFDEPFTTVTSYSNTGADIAAVGFGLGFGWHPYFIVGDGSAGDPVRMFPGETYRSTVDSFGSTFAAAYVAGAATMVFQAFSEVNATPPSDDEVWAAINSTVQFAPLDGTAGGFLNASAAMSQAMSGGTLYQPAMSFGQILISQPMDAVTRGTDLSITPMVVDGSAPFVLEIDWGNGAGPVTVDPWVNADPVTLTGGYQTLGVKAVNLKITDADGQEIITGIATPGEEDEDLGLFFHVINPLAAGITIEDSTGESVSRLELEAGVFYRFKANPTNIYTGMIGGVQNGEPTYNWDFDGDGTPEAVSGPSPSYAYVSSGDFTISLTVEETVRPDSEFSLDVQVN